MFAHGENLQFKEAEMENQEVFKSGYVSIIGEPNVGKSTLLNAMMGEKIAIVTPKPQTTRNQITGIVTTDTYQIIFLDTPGVLEPKYRLHDEMVKTVYRAIRDADIVIYMIDVNQPLHRLIKTKLLHHIQNAPQNTILAINKIDLISKPVLLPIITEYSEKFNFAEIVPISAKTGDGVLRLRELIVAGLPEGPLYFPDDQISDQPERFFVAETIREKLFLNVQKEIPYASSVLVEEFKERPNGITYIRALIYTERPSQKRILIGEQGRMIKRVGQLARAEIEQFLNTRIFLELHVSVKENWRQDTRKLKDMGYIV
jgi:GTP-binding protein Era